MTTGNAGIAGVASCAVCVIQMTMNRKSRLKMQDQERHQFRLWDRVVEFEAEVAELKSDLMEAYLREEEKL
jgi:IS4 transposase